jgi:hypothetical protein
MAQAIQEERDPGLEHQVREDAPDDRGADHVEKAGAERNQRNDEFGALPNVALSRPPMASPVQVASCSVERTIRLAIGTIASAAEKNRTGDGTAAYSSTSETGMKTKSQLSDG